MYVFFFKIFDISKFLVSRIFYFSRELGVTVSLVPTAIANIIVKQVNMKQN